MEEYDDDRLREQRRSLLRNSAVFQDSRGRAPVEKEEDDIYEEILKGPPSTRWSPRTRKLRLSRWGEAVEEDNSTVLTESWSTDGNESFSLEKLSDEDRGVAHSLTDSLSLIRTRSSASSVSSMRSPSWKTDRPKLVSFGSAEIREYAVIVGDNPSCRGPWALQLDWAHTEARREDAVTYATQPTRRGPLQLSVEQRRLRVAEVNGPRAYDWKQQEPRRETASINLQRMCPLAVDERDQVEHRPHYMVMRWIRRTPILSSSEKN